MISKTFRGGHDFETMMLTSLLGTFIALKEDLISYKQAESYWLSDMTAEMFEEIKLSDEIIELVQRGIKLRNLDMYSDEYLAEIDDLITRSKEIIGRYYTEYDEHISGILN